MAPPIIGIDLGTTNICGAVCNERGEAQLIPFRGGEFTVPSVFAISDKGDELVGHEAHKQWQLNPKNTVFAAKRLMGVSAQSDLVADVQKRMSYEIVPGSGDDVLVMAAGKTFRVAEIAGKFLATMQTIASNFLGAEVFQAVVTVPAYFNDRQRQAVYEAGKIAGLKIVGIVNEPTAAALAYGGQRPRNETVAVYDLGGGTFDISVIEIRNRTFEVKATGGDVFLGGVDFDEALIQYILADFQAQHSRDLATDAVAMQRIRDMAERVKRDLSFRQEIPLNIPFIALCDKGQPIDLSMIVRRADLESLTAHLIEKTFDTCAQVIDDAGLLPHEVDQVLLVGGQTRMPLIQERISNFFQKTPSKGVHPDEAVAIGAALYAWSLQDQATPNYQLLNVVPMAIGIETAEGGLHVLFERNSSVPNQKQFMFTTHRDNQHDLLMRIYQGDEPTARDNTLLGAFTFSGLRPGSAGSVRVEVVFDVSAEGILTLKAKDLDTKAKMQQTVRLEP